MPENNTQPITQTQVNQPEGNTNALSPEIQKQVEDIYGKSVESAIDDVVVNRTKPNERDYALAEHSTFSNIFDAYDMGFAKAGLNISSYDVSLMMTDPVKYIDSTKKVTESLLGMELTDKQAVMAFMNMFPDAKSTIDLQNTVRDKAFKKFNETFNEYVDKLPYNVKQQIYSAYGKPKTENVIKEKIIDDKLLTEAAKDYADGINKYYESLYSIDNRNELMKQLQSYKDALIYSKEKATDIWNKDKEYIYDRANMFVGMLDAIQLGFIGIGKNTSRVDYYISKIDEMIDMLNKGAPKKVTPVEIKDKIKTFVESGYDSSSINAALTSDYMPIIDLKNDMDNYIKDATDMTMTSKYISKDKSGKDVEVLKKIPLKMWGIDDVANIHDILKVEPKSDDDIEKIHISAVSTYLSSPESEFKPGLADVIIPKQTLIKSEDLSPIDALRKLMLASSYMYNININKDAIDQISNNLRFYNEKLKDLNYTSSKEALQKYIEQSLKSLEEINKGAIRVMIGSSLTDERTKEMYELLVFPLAKQLIQKTHWHTWDLFDIDDFKFLRKMEENMDKSLGGQIVWDTLFENRIGMIAQDYAKKYAGVGVLDKTKDIISGGFVSLVNNASFGFIWDELKKDIRPVFESEIFEDKKDQTETSLYLYDMSVGLGTILGFVGQMATFELGLGAVGWATNLSKVIKLADGLERVGWAAGARGLRSLVRSSIMMERTKNAASFNESIAKMTSKMDKSQFVTFGDYLNAATSSHANFIRMMPKATISATPYSIMRNYMLTSRALKPVTEWYHAGANAGRLGRIGRALVGYAGKEVLRPSNLFAAASEGYLQAKENYKQQKGQQLIKYMGARYLDDHTNQFNVFSYNYVDRPNEKVKPYKGGFQEGYELLQDDLDLSYKSDFLMNMFLLSVTNPISIQSNLFKSAMKGRYSLLNVKTLVPRLVLTSKNAFRRLPHLRFKPLISRVLGVKTLDAAVEGIVETYQELAQDRIGKNVYDYVFNSVYDKASRNALGVMLRNADAIVPDWYRNKEERHTAIVTFFSTLALSMLGIAGAVYRTYRKAYKLNTSKDLYDINQMLYGLAKNGFISALNGKVIISPHLNQALALASQYLTDEYNEQEAAMLFMGKEGKFADKADTKKMFLLLDILDKVGLKDEFINQMTDDIATGRGVINDIKTLDEMIDMIMNETDISEVSELLNKSKYKKETIDQTKTTEGTPKETETNESTLSNMSKEEIKLELRKLYRNMYKEDINIQNMDDAVLDEMILNNIKKGFINHIDSVNEFLTNYDNYIDEVKKSTDGLVEEVFKTHVGVGLKEMEEQVDRQIEYTFGDRERAEDRLSEQNAIDTEHFVDNIDELGGMTNENIDKLEVSDVVKDLLKEVSDIKQKNRGRITVKDYLDLALKYKKDIRKFNILIRFTGMYLKSIKDRLTTDINNTLLHIKILNGKENIDKIINERKELVKSISDSLNAINVNMPGNIFRIFEEGGSKELFFHNIFELLKGETEKADKIIKDIVNRYIEEDNPDLNIYIENMIAELFKDKLAIQRIKDLVLKSIKEETRQEQPNRQKIQTYNKLLGIISDFNIEELNKLDNETKKGIYTWFYGYFVNAFVEDVYKFMGDVMTFNNNPDKLFGLVNMMSIYNPVVKYILQNKSSVDGGLSDVVKNMLAYYSVVHSYLETEIYNNSNFEDYMDYKIKNIKVDKELNNKALMLLKMHKIATRIYKMFDSIKNMIYEGPSSDTINIDRLAEIYNMIIEIRNDYMNFYNSLTDVEKLKIGHDSIPAERIVNLYSSVLHELEGLIDVSQSVKDHKNMQHVVSSVMHKVGSFLSAYNDILYYSVFSPEKVNNRLLLYLLTITDISDFVDDMEIQSSGITWMKLKETLNEYYMVHHSMLSIRDLDKVIMNTIKSSAEEIVKEVLNDTIGKTDETETTPQQQPTQQSEGKETLTKTESLFLTDVNKSQSDTTPESSSNPIDKAENDLESDEYFENKEFEMLPAGKSETDAIKEQPETSEVASVLDEFIKEARAEGGYNDKETHVINTLMSISSFVKNPNEDIPVSLVKTIQEIYNNRNDYLAKGDEKNIRLMEFFFNNELVRQVISYTEKYAIMEQETEDLISDLKDFESITSKLFEDVSKVEDKDITDMKRNMGKYKKKADKFKKGYKVKVEKNTYYIYIGKTEEIDKAIKDIELMVENKVKEYEDYKLKTKEEEKPKTKPVKKPKSKKESPKKEVKESKIKAEPIEDVTKETSEEPKKEEDKLSQIIEKEITKQGKKSKVKKEKQPEVKSEQEQVIEQVQEKAEEKAIVPITEETLEPMKPKEELKIESKPAETEEIIQKQDIETSDRYFNEGQKKVIDDIRDKINKINKLDKDKVEKLADIFYNIPSENTLEYFKEVFDNNDNLNLLDKKASASFVLEISGTNLLSKDILKALKDVLTDKLKAKDMNKNLKVNILDIVGKLSNLCR